MATYNELFGLRNDDDLRNRCTVAITIAAQAKLAGTPTAPESNWAADVFQSPRSWGERSLWAVLAENNATSVAAITGATDASIQTNVDALVDSFVIAHSTV